QDTFVAPTIQSSGTTWAQFKAGGIQAIINNLASTNTAKANPTTTATVAITTATGGLAAGTYYCQYSFVDPFGETQAGGESLQFTLTGTTQLATVTLPALPTGVQSINLYLTNANGAAGTETLYATGITTTTFACSYALPADQPTESLPTANTTGWPPSADVLILQGATELVLESLLEQWSSTLSGQPKQRRDVYRQAIASLGIASAWEQAYKEAATLLWTNWPSATAGFATSAIGMPVYSWTLP
ncbi:MAG: hypothetical protein KGR26_14330, partial [Cyanobacteria bacterium REEB65]|nr:hypothetical protein [Cyanobacteria bacterium REEB65]